MLLLSYTWCFCQPPQRKIPWELIWEDNFNTLNTDYWYVQDNFDHYGGEDQVFLTENVYIENNSLVCELKNEIYSCPDWAVDSQYHCIRQFHTGLPYSYTAGWVESKKDYNFKYGYFEAKIKFPYGSGLWPAFWTFLGQDIQNPINVAEIDIAEMLGELGPGSITTNYHKSYPDDYFVVYYPENGYKWDEWHTYALEWTPEKLVFYLDEVPFNINLNHGIEDPVRLILSIGLRPNSKFEEMTFPYKMYTDYVRVYQEKKTIEKPVNTWNPLIPNYTGFKQRYGINFKI